MIFPIRPSQLLLLLMLAVVAPPCTAQPLLLRHYTVKDGLPSNVVYSIFQDRQGYVWFCTDQGISQFDGHHFYNYSINEGLPDNEIFDIAEDNYGRYWLTCYNHQPCFLYQGRIYTARNNALCRAIAQSRIDYSILFPDAKGQACLMGQRVCRIYKDSVSLDYQRVSGVGRISFYVARLGYEYFIRGGSVITYRNGRAQSFPLNGGNIYAATSKDDSLYLVTSEENRSQLMLLLLRGDSVELIATAPFPAFCYGLEFGSDGTLLCRTAKGMYHFSAATKTFTQSDYYPPNIPYNRMLRDREGNTWLSTLYDGVYMFSSSQPRIYSTTSGLTEDNVLSISALPGNGLIATFGNGNFCLIDSGKITNISLPVSGNLNRIKFAFRINKNEFLAGSDRGLYRIDLRKPAHPAMLSAEAQKACFQAGNDYLIACSGNALRYNAVSGHTATFWRKRTTTIAQDGSGRVWLGTPNGLFVADSENHISPFSGDSTLSNSRITSLAVSGDGNLLIATHKSGLFIWNGRTLRNLSVLNGLSSNSCRRVLADSAGNIWLCTDRGLDKIIPGAAHYSVYHYTAADGLITNQTADIALSGDKILVATSEGIIVLGNDPQREKPHPPALYIRTVTTHDTTYLQPDALRLRNDQNDLQISYTGIALASGGDLTYRYFLEGGSKDTVTTRLGALSLSGISPGSYRLLVWAKAGSQGQWSPEPAVLSFYIEPPFWLTGWFLSLVAGMIALAIYGLHRRRVRSVVRTGQELFGRQRRMAALEMQALRAQINPHFIFNALNSIQHFYGSNDERKANHYISLFAQLIRKTLHYSSEHWLSLAEELSMIRVYVELEQMRFKGAFDYEVILEGNPDTHQLKVPAMLVQPYVENAINHGLRHLRDRPGRLMLYFELSGDTLICIIDDNGIGLAAAAALRQEGHKSVGMSINRQRMEIINQSYGSNITADVVDKTAIGSHGTRVVLRLPVLTTESHGQIAHTHY